MKTWEVGYVEWEHPYKVEWFAGEARVKAETESEAIHQARIFLNFQGIETEGLHIIVQEISK